MTAVDARREGDRWLALPLPLGCDFDSAAEPDDSEPWQLPPGQHLVITRRGHARIATDLPDIANYQETHHA